MKMFTSLFHHSSCVVRIQNMSLYVPDNRTDKLKDISGFESARTIANRASDQLHFLLLFCDQNIQKKRRRPCNKIYLLSFIEQKVLALTRRYVLPFSLTGQDSMVNRNDVDINCISRVSTNDKRL